MCQGKYWGVWGMGGSFLVSFGYTTPLGLISLFWVAAGFSFDGITFTRPHTVVTHTHTPVAGITCISTYMENLESRGKGLTHPPW